MLIAGGADVVYVSRQLGHSSPDITLRVYADEFGKAQSAARSKAALEARFATVLQPNGGGERRKRAAAGGGNVAQLADFRTSGG